MAAKEICKANVMGMENVRIMEDSRGVRLYVHDEKRGQFPFQTKDGQAELREVVIKAGYGDKLSKPPTSDELENFTGSNGKQSEEKPEISVKEVTEATPETAGKKPFFGLGFLSKR